MDTPTNHSRRNNLIGAVVVLALFVSALVFFVRRDVVEAPAETSSEYEDVVSAGVKDTRKNIQSEGDLASVDISYPEISGLPNATAEARINAAVYAEVQSIVDGFLGRVESPLPDMAGENALSGDYELLPLADSMLPVVLSVSEYASGAAHPNSFVLSFVFDTQTGEKLALADLFKPESEYLDVLSRESRDRIKEQLSDFYEEEWVNTGTDPILENFQVFYPTETTLHLMFNPYQVASYSDGIIEIDIPYTALGSVLR